jgi:YgiT-type zinc finger domain-containing protein
LGDAETTSMRCMICKVGETRLGRTTVTLQRGSSTVIIRDMPAEVCANCGEYYLSDEMTAELLDRAEAAVMRGVEVEIQRYAA